MRAGRGSCSWSCWGFDSLVRGFDYWVAEAGGDIGGGSWGCLYKLLYPDCVSREA